MGGRLTGRVTNIAGGAPITVARIQASSGPSTSRLSLSDELGYYALPLAEGIYTVTAQAAGYMPYIMPGVRVTNEMTVGEMRQLMAHEPLDFSEAEYDLLIRSKTASLLSGACEVGALRAGARERSALRRFGEQLGMAFQIVDDLLDYTEEEAVTGKPSGNDLREHKVTLPLIYALDRLSPEGRREVARLMETSEPDDARIGGVIALVAEAGGLDYARQRAQLLAEQADQALDELAPSPARETLRDSITYVLDRRS